jgi:hypothetical protein
MWALWLVVSTIPSRFYPRGLQLLARLLPITYALRVMRQALLGGAAWAELAPDLFALAIFMLYYFPYRSFSFAMPSSVRGLKAR